jgi:hypothetical protein
MEATDAVRHLRDRCRDHRLANDITLFALLELIALEVSVADDVRFR